MPYRILITFFLLVSGFSKLFSADLPVRYLGIEQGLSNNAITNIFQDSRGFMWIGTYDGLNRFDGINFKIFRNIIGDNTSLVANNIGSIAEGPDHTFWVGTLNGLNVLDPVTEMFSYPVVRLPNGSTQSLQGENPSIKAINSNTMMVATSRKGLIVYENNLHEGRQVPLQTSRGKLYNYHVYCIEYDANRQQVWVFIEGHGLFLYDAAQKKLELMAANITQANCMKADKAGNLWIGTNSGLLYFNTVSKTYTSGYMPVKTTIVTLCLDKQDMLWVGCDGAGLYQLFPGEQRAVPFQASNAASLINSNAVYAICNDKDGRKWIGTLRGGLNIVEPHALSFQHLLYKGGDGNNKIDNFILSFCEDEKQNVFIGTDGAGLRYWNRHTNTYTLYRHDAGNRNSISSNFITNMIRDVQGDIWISTWFGAINRLPKNSNSFSHYTLFNPTTNTQEPNAWLVYEDAQKNIWASATNDGSLYLLNRKLDKFEIFDPSIINLQSMSEDREGNLWAGNYNSLIKIDRLNKQHHVFPIGHPIRCIKEDAAGNLWLGTQDAGLLLFNKWNGRCKQFTTAEGLPSNTILKMLEDKRGNLWLSTYNGLSRFNTITHTFKNYTQSDGLQSNQFSFNAALQLSNGQFLFGGIKGFNIFYPDSVFSPSQYAVVLLSGLRVDNKTLQHGDAAITQRHFETISHITLPYDRTNVSLDFLALDYSGADKIKYSYLLEGWDKTWNYPNGSRTANYSRLQKGDYFFKVRFSNPDGSWSKETQLLQLTILPPWYEKWWAYLLYVIAATGMVYGYIRYTRRQERLKYQIQLAHLENEKDKELIEKKLSFFTNISHEFRTPLSLIINPIKEKLVQAPDVELTIAFRNARRLLSLVDQLLLFRKADSGEDMLKIMDTNMIELSNGVFQCFLQQAKARQITYHFVAPAQMDNLYIDAEKIEIALFNLLSNAFKFTPEGGAISLALKEDSDTIAVIIKDSGCGIRANDKERIFDKFVQSTETGTQKTGFGIGLYLVKHFVERHNGTVICNSAPNEGTLFTITLKKGKGHLPGDAVICAANMSNHLLRELAGETEEQALPDNMPSSAGKGKAVDEVITEKQSILLVDDNREICNYLKLLFEQKYVLYMADDGVEALALADEHLPDLIISDINMKEMDGLELCQKVKQSIRLSHIPFILLTASTDAAIRLKGIEGGADDYITKPFDRELLIAKVDATLRNRNNLQQYFFDNITLRGSSVKVPAEYQEFLEKCIKVVEDNLDADDFNIKKFSKAMGMSHSALYQKVKAISGQSLNAFIRSIRLRRAAVLMLKEDMNVTQSAVYVGMGDARYFREQFVKLFGMVPSEYIKKYRQPFHNTHTAIKIKD